MSGQKLIFEKSAPGRRAVRLPELDVPAYEVKAEKRESLPLPEVAEIDLVRHYMGLSRRAFGVDTGFYPLGSCTMKYNPKLNEDMASLPGFSEIHPTQEAKGALEAMGLLQEYLCELTGMDQMTLAPSAGAQGEYTALLMIRAYHKSRGDLARKKVIVPDSAHGTNPASAAMAGFEIINIPSTKEGIVDLEALEAAVGDDTAALMLTNPNTLGRFETEIEKIADVVHGAGGLLYYDGANFNAIMGIVRPGDMGFDVVHLNLHKTFSTPHGGGGPGSGPVGCKQILEPFLPVPVVRKEGERFIADFAREKSIGRLRAFYGNFLVCVRALSYILSLGGEGLKEASENAVLNANYMMEKLKKAYDVAGEGPCMHEFVLSLENLKKETGVSAMDVAKSLLDFGVHPPTMYFPLIVHEALMVEPTETESKETLDFAAEALLSIAAQARENPEAVKDSPKTMPISRPDETKAARHPKLRYE